AAVTLTQQEWDGMGKRETARIPPNKRGVAFGMLLEPLGEADRAYLMRSLPTPGTDALPVPDRAALEEVRGHTAQRDLSRCATRRDGLPTVFRGDLSRTLMVATVAGEPAEDEPGALVVGALGDEAVGLPVRIG